MPDRLLSPLDKTSPIPLYYQLAQRLRADIEAGSVKPGELLGTEKVIQDRYGVSRATVRKALDELAHSGQLVRITGKGTYVSTPPLAVDLPHLLSFTEEMRRRGVEPGSSLLSFEDVACPADVAEALRCNAGETVLYLRRVRTGDGTPIVMVDHYLAPFVQLQQAELHQSLYETLEQKLGRPLQEAYHTLRAGRSTEEEATLLRIQAGDPVLRFQRITLDDQGQPVVFEQGSARADLYEYSVHLLRG